MKKPNKSPAIILWDIESSYIEYRGFGLWKQNIAPQTITQDKHLFCVCYQWYGEKKIHSISILDDPKRFAKNHHDDYHVVKEMHKVLSQADAHVAHYGDGFDMPMIQERFICHGLKPLKKIVSQDTCKIAKRYFKFTSNKLDWIAKKLGHPGKLVNPTNLWNLCFDGDEKALRRMVKYCKRDISALAFVYEKFRPFIKNNPLNANLFNGEALGCVNCGSLNLIKRGFNYTRVNKYKRYQCKDCGAWCDERSASKNNVRVK